MGFVIAYHPFLALRLEDDGGEPVTAFDIRPTPLALQVMGMNQILWRPRSDGLQLFYRTTPESAPPLLGEITTRVRYSFHMRLTDGAFFTRHFPDFAGDGAALHFDNLDGAGAIQAPGAIITQGATVSDADTVAMGTVPFPAHVDLTGGVPTDVELQNPISGNPLVTTPVTAAAGATETTVLLDASEPGDGLYRAVATIPAALDQRIYTDTATDGTERGAVDLYWETAQDTVPLPDGAIYRVVFQRR